MTAPLEGGPAPRNLAKTFAAALWMYGGRGVGLVWTLALISQLSVGDYGLYGMAFALASIIGPPLDNAFMVRAVRESEHHFTTERAARYLMGAALMTAGLALVQLNYIVWFALVVAGGEIMSNAWLSRHVRDGNPQYVWRITTIRQISSVVPASLYLVIAAAPSLLVASLLYCLPYVVVVVLGARASLRHRPALPGPLRLTAALTGEMLGTCVYLQGDLLVLGLLTDTTTVGYYSLTVVVAVSLAAVGQAYGMSYHEALRVSGGTLDSGPPLRTTLIIGGATGALVAVAGLVLLFVDVPTQFAVAMLLMAVFCAMRTVISVFQVVLYAQRRDLVRLSANLGLVPVKLGAVALLAGAGAVGGAVASVLTDVLLLAVYSVTLYGRKVQR